MTTQTTQELEQGENSQLAMTDLSGAIAGQFRVIGPSPERSLDLANQLFSRVRKSALAHRGFVTMRRENIVFNQASEGMACYTLRQDTAVRIVIVQLQAGAKFTWPEAAVAQEVLVIEGSLLDGSDSPLTTYQHRLMRCSGPPMWAGAQGAKLYVRQLICIEALPQAELQWWTQEPDVVPTEWLPLSDGVDLKSLRCVGDVISKLDRLAPGAKVCEVGHLLDGDCLMLEGDLFLGDILLRERDYQMAPAGVERTNGMSETGALFYFHGCLPGTRWKNCSVHP